MGINVNMLSKNYFVIVGSEVETVYDKRDYKNFPKLTEFELKIKFTLKNEKNKILIYKDRVYGWFLEIADSLRNNRDSGFVILHIATAYIEGNQQLREGKSSVNGSKAFFIKGVKRIFNKATISDKLLGDYYSQIRCGLFHDGMTKERVSLSGEYPQPLSYMRGIILVNPFLYLEKIKEDFKQYIDELNTNDTTFRRFLKQFNL